MRLVLLLLAALLFPVNVAAQARFICPVKVTYEGRDDDIGSIFHSSVLTQFDNLEKGSSSPLAAACQKGKPCWLVYLKSVAIPGTEAKSAISAMYAVNVAGDFEMDHVVSGPRDALAIRHARNCATRGTVHSRTSGNRARPVTGA